MTSTRDLVRDERDQFAFHDDIVYLRETKRGLTRETVEEISGFKEEPEWMLQFRLRAYDHFVKRKMPTWGGRLDDIDFDKIVYYRKPSEREEKSWDDVPEQIKATFEKLGIPEAERKFLAGVGAQYDSEVVYHSVREELSKIGVVFMGTDQALKEYPEIFRKHFGTVVPPEDNKFAALNSAVWSGGSFVYVPKGVEVPLPLQAYFRINGENTGQFERTLIVVEEGAKVHYIEGCTAPIYATDSLHAAVVEVIALAGSKVRYTTIQNWSNDVYNLVTKRAHAHERSIVEWIDANTGSRLTMKYPAIYLMGEGARAEVISVAVAGKGQHQDTGAKAVHLAPNTTSRIVSKSVSKDGGRATYRGQLKVSPGATGVTASVRCDALMLDDQSRSDTYPYIDIGEDDTTMTHEATVGKISADQVFYLMSRGLTENEAQNLIIQGFLEVFTKELPMEYAIEFNRLVKLEMEGSLGVTEVADPSTAPPPPRRARAATTDLSYRLDPALVERRAAGEPAWLGDERRRALAAFDALPIEPNRLYTPYVDLRAAVLGDVRAYETPSGDVAPAAAADGPGEGIAALAAFDEDRVATLAIDDAVRRAGVTVEPLGVLVARDPELARSLLTGASTLAADDRLSQLSIAAWNQGVVVRVPAGVVLDAPLVLRWATGAPGRALHTRTVIDLGEGAEATLVEELVPSTGATAGGQALFTATTEIRLAARARLAMSSLQELGPDQVAFQQRRAVIGEGADLHWALAQLGGRLVRSRVDNVLEGDRSQVEQVEIVFGADDQLHDLTSYTRHIGRDTTGQLLSKGALLGRARSYMKGLITIDKTAIGTDSYLGEFGMNLSKSARAVAIPSLEIDQPDCRRAAHASSVGPIDETQLFYLESRGIPPDDARKFIVLGFLEPVVARVPLEDARDRLRAALEAKWAAGLVTAV